MNMMLENIIILAVRQMQEHILISSPISIVTALCTKSPTLIMNILYTVFYMCPGVIVYLGPELGLTHLQYCGKKRKVPPFLF